MNVLHFHTEQRFNDGRVWSYNSNLYSRNTSSIFFRVNFVCLEEAMRAVSIWNVYISGRERFVDWHFHLVSTALYKWLLVAHPKFEKEWRRSEIGWWCNVLVFSTDQWNLCVLKIFWFYHIICNRSLIFCFIIFALLSHAVYIVFLSVIFFSPAFSIANIFIRLSSKSRLLRRFLFNIFWTRMKKGQSLVVIIAIFVVVIVVETGLLAYFINIIPSETL